MSLDTLPSMVILRIVSNLKNTADENSLHLTCRRFKRLLFRHWNYSIDKDHPFSTIFDDDTEVQQELELMRRLLRAGNLLADRGLTPCAGCLQFKSSSSEFSFKGLKIDHYKDVCDVCISHLFRNQLPGGYKYSFKGEERYTCANCNRTIDSVENIHHRCFKPPVQPEHGDILCVDCHKEDCDDPYCAGWPTSYVIDPENRQYFFGHCQSCGRYHSGKNPWKEFKKKLRREGVALDLDSDSDYSDEGSSDQ